MAALVMTQDEIDADRDAWLKARSRGVTASEIAALMGIAPPSHGSPYALFAAKTTGEDWQPDNDAMMRGRYLEPYVVERFKAENPSLALFAGGLYSHPERTWQLATFDRIAVDTALVNSHDWWFLKDQRAEHGVPVQIKTAFDRHEWGDPYSDDIPVHYRAQVLWEMDVQGSALAYVPVLFIPTWDVVTYRVEMNAAAMADVRAMRAAAEEFLARLANDDAPPVDWTPATTGALRTVYKVMHPELDVPVTRKLARRYAAAKAAKDRAEKRYQQASNELRQAIGSGHRAVIEVDGKTVSVASRSKYAQTRIDLKELRRKYPAVAKDCEVTTPVDKLSPGSWKG